MTTSSSVGFCFLVSLVRYWSKRQLRAAAPRPIRAAASPSRPRPVRSIDQPGLARGQKPGRERSADLFEQALVLAAVAQADQQQAPGALSLGDERLGDRGGLALEALGLGGPGGDGAAGGVEAGEAVGDHILAPHRKGERVGAGGALTGEADFHGRCVAPGFG